MRVSILVIVSSISSLAIASSGFWTFNGSIINIIEDQLSEVGSIVNVSGLPKTVDATFVAYHVEMIYGSEAITPQWSNAFGAIHNELRMTLYELPNTVVPANTTLFQYMRYDIEIGREEWVADNVTEYIYWPSFQTRYFHGLEYRNRNFEVPGGYQLVFEPHF